MKKIFKLLICIFSIFLFSQNLFADSAVVTYARGKVEIDRGDGWQPLRAGDEVFQSDILSTGFKSELRMNYNGSIISMAALTRITFEKLTTDGNKDIVDMYIDSGMIRAKVSRVNREPADFKARTAVSVASVRGTDFIVIASGKVSCNNGKVAVSSLVKKKEKKKKSKQIKKDIVEEKVIEVIPMAVEEVIITANQTTLVNQKGNLEEPVLTSKVNEINQQDIMKTASQRATVEIKKSKIEEKVVLPIIEPKVQLNDSEAKKSIAKVELQKESVEKDNSDAELENQDKSENKKKNISKPVLFPYINLRGHLDVNMFAGGEPDTRIDLGGDFDLFDFQWIVLEAGVKYFYRQYEMNGLYADSNLRLCIPGKYFEPYLGVGFNYRITEFNNIVETPFPEYFYNISAGILLFSHLDFRLNFVNEDITNYKDILNWERYFSIGYKIPLRNSGLFAK